MVSIQKGMILSWLGITGWLVLQTSQLTMRRRTSAASFASVDNFFLIKLIYYFGNFYPIEQYGLVVYTGIPKLT